MHINAPCASPLDFPNWHYVEASIGRSRQVCAIFHSNTPAGLVPYWYDDPDHPQRALPLLTSMSPVSLGDYGTILARGRNMSIFVGICKAIDDLPDPLVAVQVIHWIEKRLKPDEDVSRFAIRQALHAIQIHQDHRRQDFEHVMQILCGPAAQ